MTTETELEELRKDPAWRGVLHIFLNAFPESAAVWNLVDLDSRNIDFEQMFKGPWSGGERLLLGAAASLFNPDYMASLWELAVKLDNRNFGILIKALQLMRQ